MRSNAFSKENFLYLDGQGPLTGAQYYRLVSETMKKIHSKIPHRNYDTTKLASPVDIREEYFEGKNYNRVVMYLLSNGCEWAMKNGNGCTVCGHLSRQTRLSGTICTNDYLKQFTSEFEKIDFEKYPILNLYNNGSFLNDNEIPPEAQKEILKIVNQNPYIKMVVLETRPEYINETKLCEIKELIPDKHVELAVGLELYDDFSRYICINKGFSLKQFERAARLVVDKLNLRTYVMLKPPFLSEKESIDQAIEAIKYVFSLGGSTISLEGCTIQDYTLTQYLNDYSGYRTTWLWSIIEVLKKTAHLGKLVVGLFQFYPSPFKVPSNCSKCNEEVFERIRQYNRTLDVSVFNGLDCECKKEWRKEQEKGYPALEKRVIDQLGKIVEAI